MLNIPSIHIRVNVKTIKFKKKEMQTKTTLRFYLTPVIITTIKDTQTTTNVGEDVSKKEPLYTAGGNVN
jgi:hypothetical protein